METTEPEMVIHEIQPLPDNIIRTEIDIYEEGEPVETVEPSPEFVAFLAQRDAMLGVA